MSKQKIHLFYYDLDGYTQYKIADDVKQMNDIFASIKALNPDFKPERDVKAIVGMSRCLDLSGAKYRLAGVGCNCGA